MCGIAGWIGRIQDARIAGNVFARELRHRGPDGTGVRTWPGAGLVHRRLSIIDLSARGAQPIANEDESILAVVNGEIYNHRELQRELEARGHVFRGRSDSEVLPHLYEEHGQELFGRLKGMFAAAIYDARAGRLLVGRDRFGIKPVFYGRTGDAVVFASELNALTCAPGFDRAIDAQSVSDYLALSYVPAPRTFFRDARALEPGTLLDCRFAGERVTLTVQPYFRWSSRRADMPVTDAVSRADALIDAGVARQMESDVPLGSLLSGGIDSSLVSAAAQRHLAGELRTFNVRFADPEYDESWAAEAVARHIGSLHTSLDMDPRPDWDTVCGLLLHCGQPFADSSLFAVAAVSEAMRGHVTVALSGDGGDEAFAGYASFARIPAMATWGRLPRPAHLVARAVAPALSALGLAPSRLPQRLAELQGASDATLMQLIHCWLRPAEHRSLSRIDGGEPVTRLFERTWSPNGDDGRLDTLADHLTEVSLRVVMPNDYLFKVDTASMRHGLEMRLPFLDEDLVAFGLSLPYATKAGRGVTKRVLRGVAAGRLPSAVVEKPKWGFSLPLDVWLPPRMKRTVQEFIEDGRSSLREYVDPAVYLPWLEAFVEGRDAPNVSRAGLYTRVLMLWSLQLHLDHSRRVSRGFDSPEAMANVTQ